MKYRKKPVVIDAWQWNSGASFEHAPEWMVDTVVHWNSKSLQIHTLEGVMTASPGDWIIRGIHGELYPCKPDIFEACYEAVE